MLRFHLITLTLVLALFPFRNDAAEPETSPILNDFEDDDYSGSDEDGLNLTVNEMAVMTSLKIILHRISETLLETLGYVDGKATLTHVLDELLTTITDENAQSVAYATADELKATLIHRIAPRLLIKILRMIQIVETRPKGLKKLVKMFDISSINNGYKTLEVFIVGLYDLITNPATGNTLRGCINGGFQDLLQQAPPSTPLKRQISRAPSRQGSFKN